MRGIFEQTSDGYFLLIAPRELADRLIAALRFDTNFTNPFIGSLTGATQGENPTS